MTLLNSQNKRAALVWRLSLAVSGGLLSSLAFPRENLSPLIFVAVTLLFLSIYQVKSLAAFIIGLAGGLGFYLSQIEWLSLYLGPIPWLALSIMEAIIFAIGMSACALVWNYLRLRLSERSILKPIAIALSLALLWTAREWVSITIPYGGFPWSRLAQTQSDTVLARWVFWGGFGWLTFVVAFIAASLTGILVTKKIRKGLLNLPIILGLVILFTVPALTSLNASAESGTLRIGAVQGNANAGLFANPDRGSILRNHLDASKAFSSNNFDVVVWPENASDLSPFADPVAKQEITNYVDNVIRAPLIFGTITQRGKKIFNSSILWEPGIGATDWYDKKRPVPFAEYVPDRDFWYQLAPDLVGLISRGYDFGERDGIFGVANSKLGSLICFEIAIDEIGRELIGDGAQVILSQTNNADFGRSDQTFQQAAFARLRAIETGRTVVNISTVGLSAIYNSDGSVIQQLPTFEAGVMEQEVPLRVSITPAMLFGSFVDLGINFLALLLLGFAFASRFFSAPSWAFRSRDRTKSERAK